MAVKNKYPEKIYIEAYPGGELYVYTEETIGELVSDVNVGVYVFVKTAKIKINVEVQ